MNKIKVENKNTSYELRVTSSGLRATSSNSLTSSNPQVSKLKA